MNRTTKSLVTSLICAAFTSSTMANPLGGVVTSGNAAIATAGPLLTISQTTDRAIINWSSFNISAGETTHFQFNSGGANPAVLNRVAAGNPSTIAGILKSTIGPAGPIGGTVMILNTDGILFTPSSQISVGSLICSTLNLADDNEFLNNTTLHLSGLSTAEIRNQGNLTAFGDIYLIAHTVKNEGTVNSDGVAGLAAGNTVTLVQSGNERLTVEAGTGVATPVGVDNAAGGQINAVSAELKAAGGNIYALAINNGGLVRATSLVNQGGRIFLRATDAGNTAKGAVKSTGTMDIDGVQVTAADITVQGAKVDLGGTINSGTGSLVVNADDALAANNLKVTASSVQAHSGIGGSGDLTFAGVSQVNADSQSYQAGSGAGNTAVANLTGNNPQFRNSAGAAAPNTFTHRQDASIADADIAAVSQFGGTAPASYTIQSDGGSLTLATGGKVAGSSLTLSANSALGISDDLNVNSLSAAGATITVSKNVTAANGALFNGAVTLDGANQTVDAGAGVLQANNTVTKTTTGNLGLKGAGGVNVVGNLAVNDGSLTVGNTLNAGANVTASQNVNLQDATAVGAITATAGDVNGGGISAASVNAGGNVTVGSVSAGSVTATAGNVAVANNANVTGDVKAGGSVGVGGTTTVGGKVTAGTTATFTGPVDIGGDVTGVGAVTFQNTAALGGNVSGNGVTLNGAATFKGANQSVDAGAGVLQANNTVTKTTTGNLGLKGAGGVKLGGNVLLNDGELDVANKLTLTADIGATAKKTTFESTVDGTTANNQALTVNGDARFNDKVGASVALKSLRVTGRTEQNAGSVTTGGDQTYDGSVALLQGTTLSGSAIRFNGNVLGGGNDLTANGATTVGDAAADSASGLGNVVVNGATTLNAGSVSASSVAVNGATALNGGAVSTTGSQTYGGDVNLGVAQTLTASQANINGDLAANQNALTVNGNVLIGAAGANKAVTQLPSLRVTGNTVLNSLISGQTVLDLVGHINISVPNSQVDQQNKVPFARTDFITWAPNVLIYDSTAPAGFYTSVGLSVPAEDLFRRILGAALPQPKRGDPKQVEGEPAIRTGLPPGYTLGSTDTNALAALKAQ